MTSSATTGDLLWVAVMNGGESLPNNSGGQSKTGLEKPIENQLRRVHEIPASSRNDHRRSPGYFKTLGTGLTCNHKSIKGSRHTKGDTPLF